MLVSEEELKEKSDFFWEVEKHPLPIYRSHISPTAPATHVWRQDADRGDGSSDPARDGGVSGAQQNDLGNGRYTVALGGLKTHLLCQNPLEYLQIGKQNISI